MEDLESESVSVMRRWVVARSGMVGGGRKLGVWMMFMGFSRGFCNGIVRCAHLR